MKNPTTTLFIFLLGVLLLVFSPPATAQEPGANPFRPQLNSIHGGQQGTPMLQQHISIDSDRKEPVSASAEQDVSRDELSDFEQYVSQIVELTTTQLSAMRNYKGIVFSRQVADISRSQISVPVRIVDFETQSDGSARRKVQKDGGFLIGERDIILEAFRLFGIKSTLLVSTDLRQFGYDIFSYSSAAFDSSDNVPVGPDYVIGPGDEIKITVWGSIEGQWNAVVDRDGKISLPKTGVLGVAGLNFTELKETVQREFSRYYTGFEMNVTLGSLRSMVVYVVGQARRPGAYTVSALSTLVGVLFRSGGPSKGGTLRAIQLKRNGKTLVHFDFYDFLLNGDNSGDVRLMPEDVIFIPPVGPLAGIAGRVNNPAIYEMKGSMTVSDLIETAGGMSDIAFQSRVQIERIVEGSRQTVFEEDLARARDMELQAADIVKIFQVVEDRKTVRISGAVHREGEYGFSEGITVRDLIMISGGLKYYAFLKEAELTRLHVTPEGPVAEKISINIENALSGVPEDNIPLQENDYLFIRTIPDWKPFQTVSIQGEVRFPGVYQISRGETMSSLMERAGGYSDQAYLKGAIFTRERIRELQQEHLDEIVDRLEREILTESSREVSTALSQVEVEAKKIEIEQKRRFIESLKRMKATGRIVIRLSHLRLFKGSPYDLELENGDTLFIPQRRNIVNVVGSVMSPGTFVYVDDRKYESYIEMTGGFTDYADEDAIYLLKSNGVARKLSGGFLSWNIMKSRWEMSGFDEEDREVDAGDTIVVPEKLERIAWLREVKDITQILMQIAVTSGILINLF